VVALGERERRRRSQLVGAVIAGLSLVVLVVSVQAQRAEAQRAEAERSAAIARNTARMAAVREHQGDPTTALASLREVEPLDLPRDWAELARWALGAGVAREVFVHPDGVASGAWSPDGKRIVTACYDGKQIVTASNDKTARVWSADGTGEPLVLRGHGHWVTSAAFSPDGKRIFTASYDMTVRVWNADGTGEPLVLRGAAGPYGRAAWSPDGGSIAAPSHDHTVWVWTNLDPLRSLDDPKLWTATTYCMPLDVRQRLLGFSEAQSRADLDRCQRRVREVQARGSR
jgi:hypothetical protein